MIKVKSSGFIFLCLKGGDGILMVKDKWKRFKGVKFDAESIDHIAVCDSHVLMYKDM